MSTEAEVRGWGWKQVQLYHFRIAISTTTATTTATNIPPPPLIIIMLLLLLLTQRIIVILIVKCFMRARTTVLLPEC